MNKFTKKVLVTGATGGLGIATVNALKLAGYNNILAPNRTELNLLSKESVDNYFFKNKPEIVIHLASIVFGLQGNLDNQMRALSENTIINSNVFLAIQENPVEYIFYAGTVAAYPYPYQETPLKESFFFNGLPHAGEFGYAMAKRHAYAYLHILEQTVKTKFTYGIFTNLYGENDRFNTNSGHVIPSLIAKAYYSRKNNTTFEIWGDGSAERDFLHFEDAAGAILNCIENPKYELLNISSNKAVTIKEVALSIAKAAHIDSVKFLTEKPVGIKNRVVNNDRLIDIGFTPKKDLDAGLKDLYQWFEKNEGKVRV